jgi:DNA-binding response OmpR family regulator
VTVPRAPRVLVVDDSEGNRYATTRLLRSVGFEVEESKTGREALTAVQTHPDLIVLDVNLPDMTGFEVVERLRRSPELASIPVLHLSASFTSNADRARGLDQGADAYLTHPIDPTVFVATVRALIRASTADRRTREAARDWQATFDALADRLEEGAPLTKSLFRSAAAPTRSRRRRWRSTATPVAPCSSWRT